jgi:hypothetical protein
MMCFFIGGRDLVCLGCGHPVIGPALVEATALVISDKEGAGPRYK